MTQWLLTVLGSVTWFLLVLAMIGVARRVLGVRIGFLRGAVTAVIGWTVAGAIVQSFPPVHSAGKAVGLLVPIVGAALIVVLILLLAAEFVHPSGQPWNVRGWPGALVRWWRRSRRYGRILRIAARHGLGGYLGGRGARGDQAPARRIRLARSLRTVLEEGGVTFVKLGQVLATRTELLPREFTTELAKLQHQAQSSDDAATLAVLRAELPGADLAELSGQPLAAASIAQVYPGKRADGTEVAVKVRRPGIRETVERDLDILAKVAATLEARASWARRLGLVELAHGFARALTEELDFTIEARNLEAVRAADPDGRIVLPRLYEASESVLITERLRGTPLRPDTGLPDREAAARALLTTMLGQVMRHGVFHADPHPGNVLVLEDGRLALLDFGSVGRIDGALREGLRAFLLGVDSGDAAAMRDALLDILDRPERIDGAALERELGRIAAKHLGGDARPNAALFAELFSLIGTHGLAVPPEIAAVFRALATLEGTLTTLCPGFDILANARSYAGEQVRAAVHPESVRELAMRELVTTLPVLRKLPRRLDRITGSLEEGRLSVNVRLLADPRDRRVLFGALHEVLLAVLGATTGIMAALLLSSGGGPPIVPGITLKDLIGYNLLMISALIGVRLLYLAFRNQRGRGEP
ncbi:ABC1 kinase family protein [Sciscionella sediminilitoris]|uniref:ABC1 kinase family protein n=1 Tax=Sciscionella sediminilitoris TaxID=1445613 RepID=UPI0004DF7B5C|nr:AarF/UbiB family protein [Sciscionella sp. SE31]